MKILAIEKDVSGVSQDEFESHLKEEASKVWELYQSGILRECYFREDCSNAVLILESDSVRQAEDILNTLPLVREGLISFDVIPLKPYPGFSRLFSKEN